jgi:hypothetical protein
MFAALTNAAVSLQLGPKKVRNYLQRSKQEITYRNNKAECHIENSASRIEHSNSVCPYHRLAVSMSLFVDVKPCPL